MDVSFANLRCKAGEKTILKKISGRVGRSRLVCIMGPTGAGKSTLLNAIAHRQPKLLAGGSMLYDGKAWHADLRKQIGFVEQDDIVFSNLTVRQSLNFTARLRLPAAWTLEKKLSRVNTLIDCLNLGKCADTLISAISGGERKRLCIASESIVQPRLLLLDEPTSGLDSTTAVHVVQLLRDLARPDDGGKDDDAQQSTDSKRSHEDSRDAAAPVPGVEASSKKRTGFIQRHKSLRVEGVMGNVSIACTIHQPSSRIFSLFDDLLFVDDGEIIYFGPCRELVPTLATVGGLNAPAHYNPADFMMDVVSLGEIDEKVRDSLIKHHRQNARELLADRAPIVDLSSVVVATTDAAQQPSRVAAERATGKEELGEEEVWQPTSGLQQVHILSERAMLMAWPGVRTWTNFFLYLSQTLLAGLLWLPLRDDFTEDSLFSRMSFVFWTVGTWTFFPLFGALMVFDTQLKNLQKELSVASYSLHSYFTAVTAVLIPLDLFWTLLYVPVAYWMANLSPSVEVFFAFFACVLLNILVMQALGLFIAAAFLGTHNAFTFSISLVTFFFGYGGLFVSLKNMGWLANLRFINFMSYSYHLHMESVFGMGPEISGNFTCSTSGTSSFPQCAGFNNTGGVPEGGIAGAEWEEGVISGEDVLRFFEIPEDAVLVSLCVLVGSIVVFRFLSYGTLHLRLVSDGTLDDRLHGITASDTAADSDDDPSEDDDSDREGNISRRTDNNAKLEEPVNNVQVSASAEKNESVDTSTSQQPDDAGIEMTEPQAARTSDSAAPAPAAAAAAAAATTAK